ncbi:unnamed protein product [Cyclocybe aegerita]|uniref:Uncharacterized protein n=1 Tax=Cyclocybe aegerita TaxID=1973307 RepID=A0A8S0XTU4_CYCAE|nr:unnamed protein product [Cyclocybe aegerita]
MPVSLFQSIRPLTALTVGMSKTIALPPLRLVAVKVITQPSRSLIERWMNTATKDRYKHLLERIEDPDQDVDYEDFLSCLVDEHGNLRRLSRLDDEQFRFALDKLSDRKQRDRAARSRSLSPTSSTRSSLHPTPSIISRPSSPEDAMSINQANMPSDLVLLASGNQPILDDAGCPVHNRHGIFSSGNASEFSHLFPSGNILEHSHHQVSLFPLLLPYIIPAQRKNVQMVHRSPVHAKGPARDQFEAATRAHSEMLLAYMTPPRTRSQTRTASPLKAAALHRLP